MLNYVEFTSKKDLSAYVDEVKSNNINIIGGSSESPLDVDTYTGEVLGGMCRITGKTGDNSWSIFLLDVKVKGGKFSGVVDRIPFNPTKMWRKGTQLSFSIYKDKNGLKRGKIVE